MGHGRDHCVHALLVDARGIIQELGETEEVQVRTDDAGFPEGKIYIEYNCDGSDANILKIYLDNNYSPGDHKPSDPVLEVTVDLAEFFDQNERFFTAGFTAAINGGQADNADIMSWVMSSTCKFTDGTIITPAPTPLPTPVTTRTPTVTE